LKYAKSAVESMYGRVASAWEIADGKMKLRVEIPANATATVKLPDGKVEEVGSGAWQFEGVAVAKEEGKGSPQR
jgi:alpha-L-rhamnosidase